MRFLSRVLADLSLAEGQDADDVIQLLCPNDSLHVQHLAAHAVHQRCKEVGVADVQRALKNRPPGMRNGQMSSTVQNAER